MCGIAGIVGVDGRPVPAGAVAAMNDSLAHRGPDDAGLFVERRMRLATRRLVIIGIDNGRQPIASEDGRIVLVMNGEIYNYRKLRADLLREGIH